MVNFATTSIAAVIILSGTVLARPSHFRRSAPEYSALEAREDGSLTNNYVRAYDNSNDLNARSPDGDEQAPQAEAPQQAPRPHFRKMVRHARYGMAFGRHLGYHHPHHHLQSQPSRRELEDSLDARDFAELDTREPHFPVSGAAHEIAHHAAHHAFKHGININVGGGGGGDQYDRRELVDSDLYEREPSWLSVGKGLVSHAANHEAHHHHHPHIDMQSGQNQNDRRAYNDQEDLLERDFEEFDDLD